MPLPIVYYKRVLVLLFMAALLACIGLQVLPFITILGGVNVPFEAELASGFLVVAGFALATASFTRNCLGETERAAALRNYFKLNEVATFIFSLTLLAVFTVELASEGSSVAIWGIAIGLLLVLFGALRFVVFSPTPASVKIAASIALILITYEGIELVVWARSAL